MTTRAEGVYYKRQITDHQGYVRICEEETPAGKRIFTASAEIWEARMWRVGEMEHVHKMVDETDGRG